jgi:hypothetical protein
LIIFLIIRAKVKRNTVLLDEKRKELEKRVINKKTLASNTHQKIQRDVQVNNTKGKDDLVLALKARLYEELSIDGYSHLVVAMKQGKVGTLSHSDQEVLRKYSRKVRGVDCGRVTIGSGMAGPSPSSGGAGWTFGLRE